MNRDARQILTELLVLKAQGGDDHAFADLFHLWSADMRRFAAVQMNHGGQVDEIAQDAWVTIARSLSRLDDPACFPRWAFRILDRRCADWIRRRQADRRKSEALAAVAPPDLHTDRYKSGGDDIEAVRAAIARLDPEARKLVHLYYEQDCSVAEISAILDVPAGTVKSRLHAVRDTLKRHLERKSP